MQIAGKAALVTGGTDGIGLEVSRQLKAKGATVIVAARRADLLDSARAEGLEAIAADLSTAAGCAALAASVAGRPIDLLVNNAGMHGNFGPGEPLDLAFTDRAVFLNLNAPMHLIGLMLDGLKARPESVYCATKAGLRSFTQALRYNLRNTNVRVVEALPPVVETALTAERGKGKMSAKECARQIMVAIEGDHAEANVGQTKILRAVYSVSPALARRIMLRF
jgi:uncharacterized oxidoreductase